MWSEASAIIAAILVKEDSDSEADDGIPTLFDSKELAELN